MVCDNNEHYRKCVTRIPSVTSTNLYDCEPTKRYILYIKTLSLFKLTLTVTRDVVESISNFEKTGFDYFLRIIC